MRPGNMPAEFSIDPADWFLACMKKCCACHLSRARVHEREKTLKKTARGRPTGTLSHVTLAGDRSVPTAVPAPLFRLFGPSDSRLMAYDQRAGKCVPEQAVDDVDEAGSYMYTRFLRFSVFKDWEREFALLAYAIAS